MFLTPGQMEGTGHTARQTRKDRWRQVLMLLDVKVNGRSESSTLNPQPSDQPSVLLSFVWDKE